MRKRMEMLFAGKFPYIVAELDGKVAGYAYASLYRTRPAYRFTVENSVYVAPELHRRGIGKILLDRKSTRLNSSHPSISYAVFCLKKKKTKKTPTTSSART